MRYLVAYIDKCLECPYVQTKDKGHMLYCNKEDRIIYAHSSHYDARDSQGLATFCKLRTIGA